MSKIAIITGGSSGIGRATAIELARRNIGVVFTFNGNREGAISTVAEIEKASGRAVALKLDLSQSSTFPDFVLQVRKTLQEVWHQESFEYLVNNAGVGGGTMFEDVTESRFDQMIDTNLKGPFFLTQKLLPLMADGGHIVNVSTLTRLTFPGYSAYAASKAGLTVLTRYLAKELSPRRIRANTISPGPVRTNLADGAFEKHPEYIAPLAAQTALGRIGEADDIGLAIAALLSDDCRWITAQDIEVSGGFLL